ncbi:MAG: iron-containing redox enzyme family protein [Proteobacteria bacterium]|nr:iron-containing redox enzyme family protein [Pseudomonadota bacterium]
MERATNQAAPIVSRPNYRSELLGLYEQFPFERHPLWCAVLGQELTHSQIVQAEVQHYLRTLKARKLRQSALQMAKSSSESIFELLLQTYLEECTADSTGPSHLDLIKRLVLVGGYTEDDLAKAEMTPGNAAAVALYRDITRRGPACHMLGAGTVEYYYSKLSPKIFEAYTTKYKMSHEQAETYEIHGPIDQLHAERAFTILDEAVVIHGWREIKRAVRDAFVATSLHYDGMLQAATGQISYWNGE